MDVDAPFFAAEVVEGWLLQNGPCLSSERQELHAERIIRCLRGAGFAEWPDPSIVDEIYRRAVEQWQSRQDTTAQVSDVSYTPLVMKPCFPPDDTAGATDAETEPMSWYFAFMHAWLPRPQSTTPLECWTARERKGMAPH